MPLLDYETSDSPALKARVDFRSRHASDDDLVYTVEVATLSSNPYIRITDKKSKASETISLELANHLMPEGFHDATESITEALQKARRKFLDPKNSSKGTVVKYSEEERGVYNSRLGVMYGSERKRYIRVRKVDSKKKLSDNFVPYMEWQNDYDENYEGEVAGRNGWRVSLTGFDDLTLGFASWDDKDGIAKLVESMINPDSLKAMASLVKPEESGNLVSLDKAKVFIKNIPETNIDEVKAILNGSDLIDNVESPLDYYIKVSPLLLDGKIVGYDVEPPSVPKYKSPDSGFGKGFYDNNFATSFFENRRAEKNKRALNLAKSKLSEKERQGLWSKERLEEVNKWIDIFEEDARRSGWNVVSERRDTVLSEVCISKLSNQQWDEYIEPASEFLVRVRDKRKDWGGF